MLLRGLTAIAFGVLAFAWPGVTLARLVLLFGLYAMVHGHSLGGGGDRHPRPAGCLLLAIEAIVGLWAGFMTLRSFICPHPWRSSCSFGFGRWEPES